MRIATAEGARWLLTLSVWFGASACQEDIIDHGSSAGSGYPTTPPARICGSAALSGGPASAPPGAISVAAGDNSAEDFTRSDTTYWFASGVHTLGAGSQVTPGDNSTFIGAPGAILDGQNASLAAFSQHAVNVRIAYLEVRNFATPTDEGVVNHDGGTGWLMEYDFVHDNGGAGVFVSSYSTLRYSCVSANGQYGLQGIGPGGGGAGVDLTIDHNEITKNGLADSQHSGSGAKLWNVDGAVITHNWFHDDLGSGVSADADSRDLDVEGNLFEGEWAEAVMFRISYNSKVVHNTLKRNALGKGGEFAGRNDNFPVAAIYVSESGGDRRVSGAPTIEISGNYFEDNWSGVTLWENADQYCASTVYPGGYCTIVNPDATPSTCVAPGISSAPLHDDCRWKTQNVTVDGNAFHVTPANIACTNDFCARQAILSNAGTAAPYAGTSTEDSITFGQNNHYSNNHYFGPWRFVAHDTTVDIDFAAWRAPPYAQDQGSTLEYAGP